jgi:DNA-binding CsgD family transcriptional regulator
MSDDHARQLIEPVPSPAALAGRVIPRIKPGSGGARTGLRFSFDLARRSRSSAEFGVSEIGHIVAMQQIELLASMRSPAAMLNASGELAHSNHLAEALFGADLIVRNRKVAARDQASNGRLQQLVRMAVSPDTNPAVDIPFTIIVKRRERRPLLVTLLSPLDNRHSETGGYAIVLFTDPDHRPSPAQAVLRGAFGLTRAEACLAALLARGESLESAALELGVATGTARHHLKSVFEKTETHRQAELVSLLSSLIL